MISVRTGTYFLRQNAEPTTVLLNHPNYKYLYRVETCQVNNKLQIAANVLSVAVAEG